MRAGGVLAALVLSCATSAVAQQTGLIGLRAGSAEIGVQLDGQRLATDGEAATSRESRYWLALPLAGSAGGPGLLSWSFTLRPTFQQRDQSAYGGSLGARSLDMSGGVRLLDAQPVHLTLEGTRASGVSSGGFGSRREYRASSTAVTLWWRNRVFPMHLDWTAGGNDDRWSPAPGAAPIRVAVDQRRLHLSASSSKTVLDWQRARVDDHVAGSLNTTSAFVLHTARWGRGSRLESSWQSNDQDGFLVSSHRAWSERLHLDHGRAVATDHSVSVSSVRLREEHSRSTGVSSSGAVRIAPNLSARLAVERYSSSSGAARYDLTTVTPGLGASAVLPAGWRLNTSGSVAFEHRTTSGVADQSQPSVDERHELPPTRSFLLDQSPADPASVAVRSADGAVLYDAALDYALVPQGGALRVDVPPGSRIAVGDVVLVSYRYRVVMPARLDGTRAEYEVALSRRGVELRHRRQFRRSDGGSAARLAGFDEFDETRTSVDVRTATAVGALALDGVVRRWAREGPSTTELGGGASLAPPGLGRFTSTLAAHWNRSRSGGTTVEALAGTATLAWALSPALTSRGSLEAFRWDQDGRVQRFVSGTLGLDWSGGATSAGLQIELHRREFLVRNTEARVLARVVRRF